jgi:hypothetical protein
LVLAYLKYLLSISSISSISRYRKRVEKGKEKGEKVEIKAGARSPRGRGRRKGKVGPTKGPKRYTT